MLRAALEPVVSQTRRLFPKMKLHEFGGLFSFSGRIGASRAVENPLKGENVDVLG